LPNSSLCLQRAQHYTQEDFTVTATGTTTIAFDTTLAGGFLHLDDVSVTHLGPEPSELSMNGSNIIVLPARTLNWTGASGSEFANALNCDDSTDGLDPAVVSPGTLDAASITGDGTITGSGTV
jgi:hypothetical protein